MNHVIKEAALFEKKKKFGTRREPRWTRAGERRTAILIEKSGWFSPRGTVGEEGKKKNKI